MTFNITSFVIYNHRFDPRGLQIRARVGPLEERGPHPMFRQFGAAEFLPLQEFVLNLLRRRDALPTVERVQEIQVEFNRPCELRTPSDRTLSISGFRASGQLHCEVIKARA
jgi:hypothetical protein